MGDVIRVMSSGCVSVYPPPQTAEVPGRTVMEPFDVRTEHATEAAPDAEQAKPLPSSEAPPTLPHTIQFQNVVAIVWGCV